MRRHAAVVVAVVVAIAGAVGAATVGPRMTDTSRSQRDAAAAEAVEAVTPVPIGLKKYMVFMADGTVDSLAGLAGDGEAFHREVMGRTPAEVDANKREAADFFRQRFGVDFSTGDIAVGVMLLPFALPSKINLRAYTISGESIPATGWEVRDGGWAALVGPGGATLYGACGAGSPGRGCPRAPRCPSASTASTRSAGRLSSRSDRAPLSGLYAGGADGRVHSDVQLRADQCRVRPGASARCLRRPRPRRRDRPHVGPQCPHVHVREGNGESKSNARQRPTRHGGVVVLLLTAGACSSSPSPSAKAQSVHSEVSAEPAAGSWKTWVLASADQISLPPPPAPGSAQAKAELAELADLAAKRTPAVTKEAHRWSDYPSLEPWVKENMELVSEQSKNPPLASRGYGLVSVAIYDAIVATWHWKYVYNRKAPSASGAIVSVGPDPSYPNEHAAMAGAASRLLAYLFPERPAAAYDEEAEAAANARVAAGANYRSDVDAGLALGRAVAEAVIARALTDGSDHHFEGSIPSGPDLWSPPPGDPADRTQPVEPLAGRGRPGRRTSKQYARGRHLHTVRSSFSPRPRRSSRPPGTSPMTRSGSPPSGPAAQEHRSHRGSGTRSLLDTVKDHRLSIPRLARAFSLLNVAQSDAGEAAWDCKYTFWSPRPVNAIRALGLDPNFKSFLTTPNFPSYISGHSTYSAASAEVLSYLFPASAADFRAKAEEAAVSRLYGGIHFRSDNDTGLTVGTKVGQAVVDRARQDGAR